MNEPEMIFGYTREQILQMDLWFKSNALSWQIIGEKYKQGFENGVKAAREMMQEHLEETMKKLAGRE